MSWMEVISQTLLFVLVFGMSATVDVGHFRRQLANRSAILAGLFLQFVLMPLVGFLCVRGFRLDAPTGVALLVVTASPGGSYSNWWCSLFNAELALSIGLSGISSVLSVALLPLNLLIYMRFCFGEDNNSIDGLVDWGSLMAALFVVILAIASGIYFSYRYGQGTHHHVYKTTANRLGNLAGSILIVLSFVLANADKDARIWDRDAAFYGSVMVPCLTSLAAATLLGSRLGLRKPERVALAVEASYQNIGIATSVAISMFQGEDRAAAVGVPFFYGVVEAVLAFVYCVVAWRAGWTKAPPDAGFWQMLTTSYEVLEAEGEQLQHQLEGDGAATNEADGYYMVDATIDAAMETGTELTRKTAVV